MMGKLSRWTAPTTFTRNAIFVVCLSSLVYQVRTVGVANKTPQPGQFEQFLVKREDTPKGSILGNISAYDTDGPNNLSFTIPTQLTTTLELVELKNYRQDGQYGWVMDIVLKKALDRDFEPSERRLTFSCTDGQSTIALEVTLMIQDVNDEAPLLVDLPYKVTVNENQTVDTVIFSGIRVFDPDNGRGSTFEYSLTTDVQGADDEYRTTFEISKITGEIRLKRKLDYETRSIYIFKVGVKDMGEPVALTGLPADFVVTVLDVQDSPPVFLNLPYSAALSETDAVGTSVLRVLARDGDQGIPNELSYSFISGTYNNFAINTTTGWITVQSPLDRDSPAMASNGGVYAMFVQAKETNRSGQPNYGNSSATTMVTLTVQDVNDNGPTFGQVNYTAEIQENMQVGVPITFLGDTMRVFDLDQGPNSHFALTVMKNGQPFYDFQTLPAEVYSESTVLIRVNNSNALDYEREQKIVFQVVIREMETAERRSSTATVTLSVRDMNDNAPNFTQTQYLFTVSENAVAGQSIGSILAVDRDSGSYGNISYSLRGGSNKFRVDAQRGTLYVNGPLDRETTSEYFVSAEAMDGGGLRTPAEIRVVISDVNDNAPVFRRSDYEGVVKEQAANFLRPVVVEAHDDDEPNTANSLVRYAIARTPPGLETNFTINSTTGAISLRAPLDYEKLDRSLQGRIGLLVAASDSGINGTALTSTVLVNVTVEDINDFRPVFTANLYTKNILENAIEDSLVLTVTASDQDATSPNNEFFYRIDSGALDKFRIDFSSGQIFVETGARLDREERREYNMRVSATDRGNSPLTGFCNVTIILDNVNDEPPRFLLSSDAVSVLENREVGSNVYSSVATDADEDSNLRYSVLKDQVKAYDEKGEAVNVSATGVDNYFDIRPNNGSIYVAYKLDRESAERVILKIVVQDLNAANLTLQSATATLTVSLLDVNDNSPTFLPTDIFYVNVSEGEKVSTVVLQVKAEDKDRAQQITYGLATAAEDRRGVEAFSIGETTGAVSLKIRLDRESKPSHTFVITARDSGTPSLTSSATVYVTVKDENDNIPQFVAFPAVFQVYEDASVGQEVYVITATDSDLGDYGTVTYSIEGVDDSEGKFQIDPHTGRLTVAKQLDRETKAEYRTEVMATDNDPDPVNRKSRRAALTIRVLDVNDNDPQFLPLGTAVPSVPEIADVGTILFTITATDPDEGDNGTVEYTLTTDTNATAEGRAMFSVERNTGIVRVAKGLQSNAGFFYITVQASDRGTVKRSTTQRYVIEVFDVNNVIPEFTHPDPAKAVVTIAEDAPVGTLVIRLVAVDTDAGRNGQVEYSLRAGQDPRIYATFRLNDSSGELTTRALLDREVVSEYKVEVKATDHGVPTNYSTGLTLTLRVKDVNDQPPVFDRNVLSTPYEVGFRENDTSQPCSNVSVAVDRDSEFAFTIICYYLVGVELAGKFRLDVSGSLCLQPDQALDREVAGDFTNLVLRASDNCNEEARTPPVMAPSLGNPPPLYDPRRADLLWVKVNIRDVNDHNPVFVRHDLALGITRDTQFGKLIYNLREDVLDQDTEEWGVSRFQNLTQFDASPPRLADALAGLGVLYPFFLYPNGSLKLNTYFNADMSGYFIVRVRVVDKGGLTDEAQLRISLISDSQRLKVVFREGVAQVGSYRSEFSRRMSEVTNYRIVVDKVQTHENVKGVAENDKTDMFIHGEDRITNEIIPAVTLLRVIDDLSVNYEMIRLLNDFNILEIVMPDLPNQESKVVGSEDDLEKKLQMALILVSVILGVLCIVLAVVLYLTYKRYTRKLKAATALAYGSQETDLYKTEIPGTNIHSYENSNPIYLEKIMLEGDNHGLGIFDEDSVYSLDSEPSLASTDDNGTATARQSHQQASGYDEQEVFMNIFPDDAYGRRRRSSSNTNVNNNVSHIKPSRPGAGSSSGSGVGGQRHAWDNNPSHSHNHSRAPRFLKAVISEHETSSNLQANDLAKDLRGEDKMALASAALSSASISPPSSSANNSTSEEESGSASGVEGGGGKGGRGRGGSGRGVGARPGYGGRGAGGSSGPETGRGSLLPAPLVRPLVFSDRSGLAGEGEKDYGDGTVTRSINGLPSTEI